jgi:putative inorganic carbon (hco3(-)) transporter
MILFYILIFSLPLSQHWLFGAGIGDFTVVKFLALACLPFALLRLFTRLRSGRLSVPELLVPLIVYSVIALFSYFGVQRHGFAISLEKKSTITTENLIFSMLLFFILVTGLIDSMTRLYRGLLTLIGSVAITSLYVVRDWSFNRSLPDYRPGGVSGDANYYALCAVTALVLALHLALSGRPRSEKLFLYGCIGMTTVGFLMAASRGGMLGLAAGLLFFMIRSGRGMRILAMAALLMTPLLFIVPNTMMQRIRNPGRGDEQAVEARKTTWKAGLRMIAQHPIVGVGLGQFENVVTSYEDPSEKLVHSLAHNTYIEIAAELGIPGLLAYLALLISSFRVLTRFAKSRSGQQDPLLREVSIGLQAAFVAAAVCAFFVSAWWFRFFWFVLFLPACLPAVKRSLARRTALLKPEADLAVVGSEP